MVSAPLAIGTGCGGFSATPSFSPLLLLLPGLAQTPVLPQPPEAGRTDANPALTQAD